jgi:hypothetical protein
MRLAAICVVCLAGRAAADDAPWQRGTTAPQRSESHRLFAQGNESFYRHDYARSLSLYEQALAIFAHPRVELAISETLALLGRPAEAYDHLAAALKFGVAPFDEDEYARAKALRDAVSRQVGTLIVGCVLDGARVTLDGRELPACPGTTRRVVMLGPHQIVGRMAGRLTTTENVVVAAGQEVNVQVRLDPVPVYGRPWAPWKPWAVVGGGVAIALAGVPLQLAAQSNIDAFRQKVASCGTLGCPSGDPAFRLEARSKLENRLAIAAWSIGGAAAATGLVLVYLNRERAMSVAPVVGTDHIGLAFRF